MINYSRFLWWNTKILLSAVILIFLFTTSFAENIHHQKHKYRQHKYRRIHLKKPKYLVHSKKKKHHIAKVKSNTHKQITKKAQAPIQKPVTNIINPHSTMPATSLVASLGQRLVNYVHKTVTTLRYSAYKLGGTHFDPSRGVYIVDCSSYVDYILKTIHPRAFSKLVNWSGSPKPTTDDYYHFFNKLSDMPQYYWTAVDDVESLRPGDILVFRNKNKYGVDLSGHIMIVMEKPVRDKDVFWLRIADSAPHRHSLDTRLRHISGIGIGTFLVKVNPKTSAPAAYAWTANSPWRRNVDFAMGRPIEIAS